MIRQQPSSTGTNAVIDIAIYEPALFNAISTVLGSQSVNGGTFPFFVTHSVAECEGPSGTNCGALGPTSLCCILGFHDFNGLTQTLGTADFDTSGIFGNQVRDVSDMSHEVAEWMNDPFGNNPVAPWGHIGQQPGCQGNLEVGDPLSGTYAPAVFDPANGFMYHLQELAFFSWFYGAPSVGIHGWFSNNDTFTTDAGPVCTPSFGASAERSEVVELIWRVARDYRPPLRAAACSRSPDVRSILSEYPIAP